MKTKKTKSTEQHRTNTNPRFVEGEDETKHPFVEGEDETKHGFVEGDDRKKRKRKKISRKKG